jgi:hypothetical protein
MGESGIDHFLASWTPFVHFQVVSNAFLMEKVSARKIGAHDTSSQLLIASKASKFI